MELEPTMNKRRRRRTRGRKQGNKQSSSNKHHDDDDATTVASSGSDRSHGSSNNSAAAAGKQRGKQQQQQQQQPPLTKAQQDQYLAIDCEMVGVGPTGQRSVLARVTLVDWHHEVVYDTYVTPTEDVTDYRYFVSGITEHDLVRHGIDFATCRRQVAERLVGKILVGHALKNDLAALQLSHPWHLIRDTAKYEPFMKKLDNDRYDEHAMLWPRKLKELTHEKLKRTIQPYGIAHCPVEDAVAALQLYQLVRVKWESIMDYKIQKTAEIMQQQQQLQAVLVTQ
jgi:RNA exonuclease 4